MWQTTKSNSDMCILVYLYLVNVWLSLRKQRYQLRLLVSPGAKFSVSTILRGLSSVAAPTKGIHAKIGT